MCEDNDLNVDDVVRIIGVSEARALGVYLVKDHDYRIARISDGKVKLRDHAGHMMRKEYPVDAFRVVRRSWQ